MKPFIPDRASDAGPDTRGPDYDWRDHLDFAGDEIRYADRAEACEGRIREVRNCRRIVRIDAAIAELEKAKELLCR